jgi:hypothetical protein
VVITVVWRESPGVVVVAQVSGLTGDEVVHAAETLRSAPAAEWDEMVRNRPG